MKMAGSWIVWGGGALAIALRLLLVSMGSASLLDHRVEVVSSVTSLARCKLPTYPSRNLKEERITEKEEREKKCRRSESKWRQAQ